MARRKRGRASSPATTRPATSSNTAPKRSATGSRAASPGRGPARRSRASAASARARCSAQIPASADGPAGWSRRTMNGRCDRALSRSRRRSPSRASGRGALRRPNHAPAAQAATTRIRNSRGTQVPPGTRPSSATPAEAARTAAAIQPARTRNSSHSTPCAARRHRFRRASCFMRDPAAAFRPSRVRCTRPVPGSGRTVRLIDHPHPPGNGRPVGAHYRWRLITAP